MLPRSLAALALFFVFSVANGYAETKTTYEYPELLVTPLASERLHMEAKEESGSAWKNQSPLLISAGSTILAGFLAMSDPGTNEDGSAVEAPAGEKPDMYWVGTAAVATGVAWAGVSAYFAATHRPYTIGTKAISKLPSKSKRQRLTRERIAEEHLLAPASIFSRMKWLSTATNFVLTSYIAGKAHEDNTKILGSIASVMTLAPFILDNQWEGTACKHLEYKKKIYGPVTSISLIPNRLTAKIDPAVTWTWAL